MTGVPVRDSQAVSAGVLAGRIFRLDIRQTATVKCARSGTSFTFGHAWSLARRFLRVLATVVVLAWLSRFLDQRRDTIQ